MAEMVPLPASPASVPARRRSTRRQRDVMVSFRATAAERAALGAAAERAGLSVGAYLRAQVLPDTPGRAVRRPGVAQTLLAHLLGQVGKVGSNLNQLAKRANSGAAVPEAALAAAVAAWRATARAILQALGKRPVERRGDDH